MPALARRLAALVPCLALVAGAAAEDGSPVRVAVIDIRAVDEHDAQLAERLTGFVVSEAGQHAVLEVISSGDVRAIIGFEAERQLMGCEDDATCLAEIAGALGSRYLLVGELSRAGTRWLLLLSLLDMEEVRALGRANRRAATEDELFDATSELLDQVLGPLLREIDPGHEARAPAREPALRPGRTRPGGFIHAPAVRWGGAGTGLVAAAVGGWMYAGAREVYREWDDGRQSAQLTVTREEALSARTRGGVGIGLLAGGAGLAVTALVLPAVIGGPGVDDGAMSGAAPASPELALGVHAEGFSLSLGWRW